MSVVLDPSGYGGNCGEFLQASPSFSKLKLIKTYLRSTMCQVRLSSLGMLSFESQRLSDLNIHVEEIIDIFADAKARRKPL
jgi:hypothetical protein